MAQELDSPIMRENICSAEMTIWEHAPEKRAAHDPR
jgi:hypothetical protein